MTLDEKNKQMTGGPLLAIVIPTFQRLDYLLALLDDIDCQVRDMGEEANKLVVQVIDNCSEDHSWSRTVEHVKDRPYVWLSRNPSNLGIEGNLISGMLNSKGIFTWFLSDHQRLGSDVLARTVAVLSAISPDIICMDLENWSSPLQNRSDAWVGDLDQCTERERSELLFYFGNMSSLLCRTELLCFDMRLAYRIAWFHYPHLAFYRFLSLKSKVARISNASKLPGGNNLRRLSDSYNRLQASFIDNLSVVRFLTESSNIRWKTAFFQTLPYRKTLLSVLAQLLASKQGERWRTTNQLCYCALVNLTPYIGVCSIVIVISALVYWLPFFIRHPLVLFAVRRYKPDSAILDMRQRKDVLAK